jgi:hypothetical protein
MIIGGFRKTSWWFLPVIIHKKRWIFHEINQSAIGDPPFVENPKIGDMGD